MERNRVFIRCNVGLTTRVTDTVLQVGYDAINWSVCDNYIKTFRFCCCYHAFREVSACTVRDNKRKTAAKNSPGLLYGFLFVLMIRVRQMAVVTPELIRRQSITEPVGVRVSNYLDSTLRHTDFSVAPSSWPCPCTQPYPRRVMWDWTKPVSRDWSHINAWKRFPVSAGLAVPRWRSTDKMPAVHQFAPYSRTIQVQVFFRQRTSNDRTRNHWLSWKLLLEN